MPNRIAVSNLNASTIDILNVIRQNASLQYQSLVPTITNEIDIPKVGDILFGYPALANEFLNALMNRIAMTVIRSMTFNDPFEPFNKGQLGAGEVVEEIFVGLCKAREFSVEKAEAREFKRTIPDVKSAFHSINWKVQYPITIEQNELKHAFASGSGVTSMIQKIISQVYESAKYDNYLLHKYLMIKAITSGKMKPVAIDSTNLDECAINFRGVSNMVTFPSKNYNSYGVTTATPLADQYLFMDAMFYAKYSVSELASAFNMSQADFITKVRVIDSWSTFDNDRFDVIRANCDMIESVTATELGIMDDVVAVLIDKEWFQVYDDTAIMTDKQVASGLYWNYFYNIFKIVSSSPFSTAVVFVDDGATTTAPASLTATIINKTTGDGGNIYTLAITDPTALTGGNYTFIQTEDMTEDGIAVHPYGAIIFPYGSTDSEDIVVECCGNLYTSTSKLVNASAKVGDTLTLNPPA